MELFFLEQHIASKRKGNEKGGHAAGNGTYRRHSGVHNIPGPGAQNADQPGNGLIGVKVDFLYKSHDFPVVVRKFPYPVLHLGNKVRNGCHQGTHGLGQLGNHPKQYQNDYPYHQQDGQ